LRAKLVDCDNRPDDDLEQPMFDVITHLLIAAAIGGYSVWTWKDPGWRGVSMPACIVFWSASGLAVIGLGLSWLGSPIGLITILLWAIAVFFGVTLAERLGLTTKSLRLAWTWRDLGYLSDEVMAIRARHPDADLDGSEASLVARIDAGLRSLDRLIEPDTRELVDLIREAFGYVVSNTTPSQKRQRAIEKQMAILSERLPAGWRSRSDQRLDGQST
jgi:hypothetical protein